MHYPGTNSVIHSKDVVVDVNHSYRTDLRSSPKSKKDASRLKRKFSGQITADSVIDTFYKTGEAMNFFAEEPPTKSQKEAPEES